jgi:hypothetical protein
MRLRCSLSATEIDIADRLPEGSGIRTQKEKSPKGQA